jgi:hypothetical protein
MAFPHNGVFPKVLGNRPPSLRGVKEWWIEVKTKTGQEGWVLMEKTTHDRICHSGTFGDLCILD